MAKEKKKTGTLQIVSLGDSLTRGVGDKEGIGYVGRMKEDLQKIISKNCINKFSS